MTSYDSLLDIDESSFDLPDSSEYQLQVKYSYQKGKLQKPRRNRSAFIIFSSETRAKLKLDEGNLNSNEMMVKLAELWKNLSNEERDRYENLAKEDRLRYQQELIEFTKFNPNETIHNKTKNNHVKKPCSAYGIFLKERKDVIKNQHPDYKMADVLKIVSQEWKNLPEDQKQKYQNKATVEKEVIQTKISEGLAREQVAQESLQPKNKKQVKRNGSDEALETSTQITQLNTINTQMDISPLLKHNSSLSTQKSWPPKVGESLYIPIQPNVGLPDDYLKMEHSPSMDTIRSLSHHSSSNFESMMQNHYVNQQPQHQMSNDSRYYNPAMNQVNQVNQAQMAQMTNAMMANYMNMGMSFDRMSSTQTNPESYIGQYQSQPVQKQLSHQSSMSQQHVNHSVNQTINQPVNRQVSQQPNQQINRMPTQQQVISQQVRAQVPQPQVNAHPVMNVDINLFNKFMDNFASSDFLLDDPLFEKGDF